MERVWCATSNTRLTLSLSIGLFLFSFRTLLFFLSFTHLNVLWEAFKMSFSFVNEFYISSESHTSSWVFPPPFFSSSLYLSFRSFLLPPLVGGLTPPSYLRVHRSKVRTHKEGEPRLTSMSSMKGNCISVKCGSLGLLGNGYAEIESKFWLSPRRF